MREGDIYTNLKILFWEVGQTRPLNISSPLTKPYARHWFVHIPTQLRLNDKSSLFIFNHNGIFRSKFEETATIKAVTPQTASGKGVNIIREKSVKHFFLSLHKWYFWILKTFNYVLIILWINLRKLRAENSPKIVDTLMRNNR